MWFWFGVLEVGLLYLAYRWGFENGRYKEKLEAFKDVKTGRK